MSAINQMLRDLDERDVFGMGLVPQTAPDAAPDASAPAAGMRVILPAELTELAERADRTERADADADASAVAAPQASYAGLSHHGPDPTPKPLPNAQAHAAGQANGYAAARMSRSGRRLRRPVAAAGALALAATAWFGWQGLRSSTTGRAAAPVSAPVITALEVHALAPVKAPERTALPTVPAAHAAAPTASLAVATAVTATPTTTATVATVLPVAVKPASDAVPHAIGKPSNEATVRPAPPAPATGDSTATSTAARDKPRTAAPATIATTAADDEADADIVTQAESAQAEAPAVKPAPATPARRAPPGPTRVEHRPLEMRDDLTRAGEAMAIGRNSDALVLLRKVLQAQPTNERAHLALLSLLSDRGRDDTWRAALVDAARAMPQRFGLAAAQGLAESGHYDQCAALLQSLPENVRDLRYYAALGTAQQHLSQHEAAAAAFENALALAPADSPLLASLLVARAVSLKATGKAAQARADLERVGKMADAGAEMREFARKTLTNF